MLWSTKNKQLLVAGESSEKRNSSSESSASPILALKIGDENTARTQYSDRCQLFGIIKDRALLLRKEIYLTGTEGEQTVPLIRLGLEEHNRGKRCLETTLKNKTL